MTIVKEFIDALSIEIDALKRGKGGSIVTVYNGELIRQTLDLFIYQFTLENFLIALDDTPANIEVNGKEYECDIISVTGQQVQISIKQKLSERIPSAKIKTNTWYLLERLKKKYEENLNTQNRFDNSDKLFQDQNSKIDGGNFNSSYSITGYPPNPSQHKAIESSINDFISIIWGPPGTGKTATIARAIESHLNIGRKVLLLSHSNNAVDQALTKVAEQMKKNYYNEGQLVRLGTPKAEMLKIIESKCPLVLIDKIAEFKSKELIREKEELNRKLEKIKEAKQNFEIIITTNNELSIINAEIEKQKTEIQSNDSKINSLRNENEILVNQISELENKLEKANGANFLQRTFLGLDPIKIEGNLKNQKSNLAIKSNQLKNIEGQANQIKQRSLQFKNEKQNKESELARHLAKSGKTFAEVQKEINEFDSIVKNFQVRLDEINKAVEEIKVKILKDSKLVATTLTKSYIAKEIETIDFDILIVDEVSMAPMPMLYWAASKVKKGITIVGDFKQLPPICIADDDLARKWLGRSIFEELHISEISRAEKRVQLLDTQYRMHPDISEIPNKKIYDNRLKDDISVKQKIKHDTVSGNASISLIDTSLHNPWCSQFETGGRFNLINALICVSLAEKIAKSLSEDESIGIITPYRNQARLILKIAEDKGTLRNTKIRVNTVHSFQGGEETAIIFDSVEGEGAKKWSMINEYNNTESAKLLLNVALTRAEKKLYVIANCNHIKKHFESNTLFMDVLRHIISKGKEINSTEILSDLKDENFNVWIQKLNSLKNRPANFETGYKADEFWPAFHNDLANAEQELIIFSPFITSERLGKLHLIFSELLSKGVSIYLITLPPNEQPPIMQGAKEAIIKMKEMGIIVKFRQSMHEKIALIDREIKWIGSLNILSHNTRKEYMERVEGESSSKELFERFDLEDLLINPNINGEICPKCNKNFITAKYSNRFRKSFYSCCGYPECNFTADIRTRSFDDLNNARTNTRQRKQKTTANKTTESGEEKTTDLFGNTTNGRQWETPLCYWSSVQLPGYIYSKKKNAWWKKKR